MVDRVNPNNMELLPRLMQNTRVPAPPGALPLRTAMLRHNTQATYVVPGDYPLKDDVCWFPGDKGPAEGSQAAYLIDGPAAFSAMLEALELSDQATELSTLLQVLDRPIESLVGHAQQLGSSRCLCGVERAVEDRHSVVKRAQQRRGVDPDVSQRQTSGVVGIHHDRALDFDA